MSNATTATPADHRNQRGTSLIDGDLLLGGLTRGDHGAQLAAGGAQGGAHLVAVDLGERVGAEPGDEELADHHLHRLGLHARAQ